MDTFIRRIAGATCATVATWVIGAGPCRAEQIVVGFVGSVTYIDDFCLCMDDFTVGDTLIGYYIHETPGVDTNPNPKVGVYDFTTPPARFVAYLNGYKFETNPASVDVEAIVADSLDIGSGARDRFILSSWSNNLTIPGYPTTRLFIQFTDPSLQALSSDDLLTGPPNLAVWTDQAIGLIGTTWSIFADVVSTQWGPPTGIDQRAPPVVVLRNVPNPFGSSTSIEWSGATEVLSIGVFDVAGRLVRKLAPSRDSENAVVWDGRDSSSLPVPSGIYFVRLSTPEVNETRKMVLIR